MEQLYQKNNVNMKDEKLKEEKIEKAILNEESSGSIEQQNQTHNVAKESMGPNTRR